MPTPPTAEGRSRHPRTRSPDPRQSKDRSRRALTHVGGPAALHGDPASSQILARALALDNVRDSARAHVHGFHSYPARMHADTAHRLVAALSSGSDRVLDPFCGSGTVLVEARLLGRAARGVDANPLAVRLANLKVRGSSPDDRARLVAAAARVAAVADARRKARAGAGRRYGPEDVALFDPHVLLELDGLRIGLDRLDDVSLRADLELVLSAILTKISRRASDTSARALPRRIAAGYAARLFVRKAEELAARLAEVAPRLALAPPARVVEGDARVLRDTEPASIDLVVTSPPYPGVYDYMDHHAARLRWLRIPDSAFDRDEIGARRRLDPLGAVPGRARWRADLAATLAAIARALRPGAPAVLLLADSVIAGAPVYALDLVRSIAPAAGLALRAAASQERPHFHGPTAHAFKRRARHEHAILLIREKAR